MPEVVTIAPMGRHPGLVAYECPKCAYATSVLALSATSHPTARRLPASFIVARADEVTEVSLIGTTRTSGDVRLESGNGPEADIDQVAVADAHTYNDESRKVNA
jgi:hypothetical protein